MTRRVKAAPRHWVVYAIGRGILALAAVVPFGAARWMGRWLGRLGRWPFGIRRRVVERQIAGAFPGADQATVRRIARESYGNLGEVMIETARLPGLGRRGVLDLFEGEDGFESIVAAHQAGRGIILITGHFGNWELAGAYVAARGIPIEAVVRRLNNPLFDRYVTRTREKAGMRVVRDRDAVRRTPRAFREGHAVAFVADQGVLGLASTFVPFFGRPAKTPRGPAVFAMRTRVPTLFVAAVRQPSGRFRCVVTPVEIPDTGDREADVDMVVARFTSILESWVRRYPGQYFWHHKRWKLQPHGTPPDLLDPVMEPQRVESGRGEQGQDRPGREQPAPANGSGDRP
ncbi:MAG TPA: lysophospholipid acyltransferase family protein [Gemmatimonadaceae bacterium]